MVPSVSVAVAVMVNERSSTGAPAAGLVMATSGAAACAVDYSTLVTLTQVLKLYYLTSAAIAFMLGSTVSYILNITWVFDRRAFEDRRMEAALFFSIGAVGLLLNHYCIRFFTESAHLHYMVSKVISTIAVFAVNFSARKYILFRGNNVSTE